MQIITSSAKYMYIFPCTYTVCALSVYMWCVKCIYVVCVEYVFSSFQLILDGKSSYCDWFLKLGV